MNPPRTLKQILEEHIIYLRKIGSHERADILQNMIDQAAREDKNWRADRTEDGRKNLNESTEK